MSIIIGIAFSWYLVIWISLEREQIRAKRKWQNRTRQGVFPTTRQKDEMDENRKDLRVYRLLALFFILGAIFGYHMT